MTTRLPIKPWPWKLVEIVWTDAMSQDKAWNTLDYHPPLPIIHTVGWLVHEDDDRYQIAATVGLSEDADFPDMIDSYGQIFFIPKGMVKSIVEIEDAD